MSSNATRFESVLEAVPDALVGMDQKGVIRFVNRQVTIQVLGVSFVTVGAAGSTLGTCLLRR